MNKYSILFFQIIFFLLVSCENNNKPKNDITGDPMTPGDSSKPEDTTTLESTVSKFDSVTTNRNTPSFSNGSNLKTDDYIEEYPDNKKAGLRRHIEWLRKEWQNIPNPITATYQGNDFGDYHHILFKDANGVTYDFGQANNDYGQFNLHELSGQYEDNPEFLGKKFKVYWDWKLSDFFCCEGEYGKAKAYLPSITKLELIKN